MRLTVEQRFWAKVQQGGDDECWPWAGAVLVPHLHNGGYGQFRVSTNPDVRIMAHRMAYQLVYGDLPSGMEIDHACHDPRVCRLGRLCPHRRCCNPAHLTAVTHRDNVNRGRL